MFRFEELWFEDEDECAEIVAESWSERDRAFLHKIEAVGHQLDSWRRAKYSVIFRRGLRMQNRFSCSYNEGFKQSRQC